ncbi:MAG: HAD-IA family hydrolase [Aigarchaeota archaeon]|nr:HAD-IA family hydrolase [Aigarchaeota archaeon]MDW7986485.1 HAD-IA family hydrolase [Nitrososphaerota archaeon]
MKVVTFDLYGTLVDWKNSISSALDYIYRGISEMFFENEFSIIKSVRTYVPYSSILIEALKKTLDEVGLDLKEEYKRLIVTSFSKSPFFPDSIIGLVYLKEKRFKTGIISNTERRLVKITLSGVEDLFDYVVTAEDTGFYKPDKNAFLNAYKIMGVNIEEVVHVSSYPQYDLESAEALGIRTVCLDRYGYEWKTRIPRLDMIVDII